MEEPLSYWVAVARIGFEDDFHRLFEDLGISQAELARRIPASEAYVSRFLNGSRGNYSLETMAKWARAVGGVVQVRILKEEGEAVRVVDYETARAVDAQHLAKDLTHESQLECYSLAPIVNMQDWLASGDSAQVKRKSLGSALTPSDGPVANHG